MLFRFHFSSTAMVRSRITESKEEQRVTCHGNGQLAFRNKHDRGHSRQLTPWSLPWTRKLSPVEARVSSPSRPTEQHAKRFAGTSSATHWKSIVNVWAGRAMDRPVDHTRKTKKKQQYRWKHVSPMTQRDSRENGKVETGNAFSCHVVAEIVAGTTGSCFFAWCAASFEKKRGKRRSSEPWNGVKSVPEATRRCEKGLAETLAMASFS